MSYNRAWFKKDRYGLTIGGGKINNPGRYLVLLPPINGETAPSAAINSPYFSGNPSDPYKAWDSSITFDYMPGNAYVSRSTTIAMPACRIGRGAEELRLRVCEVCPNE